MKTRLACILLFVMVGCNEQPQTPETQSNESTQETAAARLEMIKETERFNQNLVELSQLALAKEAATQYSKAATVRSQIRHLVAERMGASSWQFFNANLAYERAFQKASFSDVQLAADAEIRKQILAMSASVQQGELAQASAIGTKLVRSTEKLYGANSIDAAQALVQLATLENRNQQHQAAIEHFHRAIEVFRQHKFGDHPELEMAHAGLASAYAQQSKLTPAAANQKEATRIAGQIWGRDSLAFATQANQLGVIFHRAGNLDVAFEILDRSRGIRESQLGTDHVAYAHSCLNLGVLMMDLNRSDNAEVYLKRALQIFERDFGTDQAITNRAKSNLATIYMLRKQPQLAEPLLRNVVGSLNEGSDEWLAHTYRLSIAYAKQGKYDQAKPIMEKVVKQQKELYGQSDERTVTTMRAYALVLDRTHQAEAAETVKQHINRVAKQIDTNDFQQHY